MKGRENKDYQKTNRFFRDGTSRGGRWFTKGSVNSSVEKTTGRCREREGRSGKRKSRKTTSLTQLGRRGREDPARVKKKKRAEYNKATAWKVGLEAKEKTRGGKRNLERAWHLTRCKVGVSGKRREYTSQITPLIREGRTRGGRGRLGEQECKA